MSVEVVALILVDLADVNMGLVATTDPPRRTSRTVTLFRSCSFSVRRVHTRRRAGDNHDLHKSRMGLVAQIMTLCATNYEQSRRLLVSSIQGRVLRAHQRQHSVTLTSQCSAYTQPASVTAAPSPSMSRRWSVHHHSAMQFLSASQNKNISSVKSQVFLVHFRICTSTVLCTQMSLETSIPRLLQVSVSALSLEPITSPRLQTSVPPYSRETSTSRLLQVAASTAFTRNQHISTSTGLCISIGTSTFQFSNRKHTQPHSRCLIYILSAGARPV